MVGQSAQPHQHPERALSPRSQLGRLGKNAYALGIIHTLHRRVMSQFDQPCLEQTWGFVVRPMLMTDLRGSGPNTTSPFRLTPRGPKPVWGSTTRPAFVISRANSFRLMKSSGSYVPLGRRPRIFSATVMAAQRDTSFRLIVS